MTWIWSTIGSVVLLLAIALGIQTHHVASLKDEIAENNASFAAQIASAQASALKQTQDFRAQEQTWQQAQLKAANEATAKANQAHADAVAAGTVADRLRARVATLVASVCRPASNSAAAGVSQAAPTASVLADMFSESIGLAQSYAAIADDALTAGEQCEADYPMSFVLKGSLNLK